VPGLAPKGSARGVSAEADTPRVRITREVGEGRPLAAGPKRATPRASPRRGPSSHRWIVRACGYLLYPWWLCAEGGQGELWPAAPCG